MLFKGSNIMRWDKLYRNIENKVKKIYLIIWWRYYGYGFIRGIIDVNMKDLLEYMEV